MKPVVARADNGWYAQGQMYAGLWGELGVQLDLLFVRFRAPILSMSAAMLLQGNFPNPSGFRGRAAVHFSVLNDAITGDASFYAEAGQQCTLMAAGDPLADFKFIHDLGPKGSNVSVLPAYGELQPAGTRGVGSTQVHRSPNTHAVDGDDVRGNRGIGPVDAAYFQERLETPHMHLIDARSQDRYRGENETIDPVGGHIPGAVNRFFRDNLQADGRFKPAAELRAEWLAVLAGNSPTAVVLQCGSGVSACHNMLAMEIADLPSSRLYAGSWSEWCADRGRPVARG